ncbi:MAG: hypothetical protein QOA17_11360 [Nitrososphaeraceae archaeon]|nr:hypothetical protein [Nitrososphaeraceae archaeon]
MVPNLLRLRANYFLKNGERAIFLKNENRGSGGRKSPSRVQGRSPGGGSGGRSPPEAEAVCAFYH